ncbi:putative pectate lyase [Neofusicoccum parvum UCRNP2]|uniref:Pectate lyase n=1 Tax=Botryosphaeria parva (strain UCR-NP2) TaxID=1287680 RepID=R1GWZ4_BOTPV|nr:putative pectate lyase [Neofusicoccum parvum UCRNP2]
MQCDDQGNTGPENAVFVVAPGGTLRNCVIGPAQVEGVHCEGECVLENVWFEDVCEDAVTFRQERGTSYVVGGGAFNAVDKIMNHNGGGTVVVQNYYAEQFGKIKILDRELESDTSREDTSSIPEIRMRDMKLPDSPFV